MIASKQTYSDTTIYLDGSTFLYCHFDRCKLVYSGLMPVSLDGNSFVNCQWTFSGPAAAAISFMAAIYSQGGQALVEQTFNNIRNSKPVTQ